VTDRKCGRGVSRRSPSRRRRHAVSLADPSRSQPGRVAPARPSRAGWACERASARAGACAGRHAARGGGPSCRHDRADAWGLGAPLQRRRSWRARRSLPFRPPLRLERGSASHPQGPGSQRPQTRAGRVRCLARPRLARPGRAPLLGVVYSETGMLRLLHSLDLSWQKARPVHPEADLKAQARFKKACLR
jgi:hypothetical protein